MNNNEILNPTLRYVLNNIETFFVKIDQLKNIDILGCSFEQYSIYCSYDDSFNRIMLSITDTTDDKNNDVLEIICNFNYNKIMTTDMFNWFNNDIVAYTFENDKYRIDISNYITIPCTEEEYFMKSLKGDVYDYNEYLEINELKSKIKVKIDSLEPNCTYVYIKAYDGYLSTTQLEELMTEFWKRIKASNEQ